MVESESTALPFGDSPKSKAYLYYNIIEKKSRNLILKSLYNMIYFGLKELIKYQFSVGDLNWIEISDY